MAVFTMSMGPTCHRVRVQWGPHVIRPLHPHPAGTSSLLPAPSPAGRAPPPAGRAPPPAASSAQPRAACSARPRLACREVHRRRHPFMVASSSSSATAALTDRETEQIEIGEGETGEAGGRWRGESRVEPLRPSNFEGRSQLGSQGNIPLGVAPHPSTRGSGSAPLRSCGSTTKHTGRKWGACCW
jgi:hypothetical protein